LCLQHPVCTTEGTAGDNKFEQLDSWVGAARNQNTRPCQAVESMNKSKMFFEKYETHKNIIDELKYFNRVLSYKVKTKNNL